MVFELVNKTGKVFGTPLLALINRSIIFKYQIDIVKYKTVKLVQLGGILL